MHSLLKLQKCPLRMGIRSMQAFSSSTIYAIQQKRNTDVLLNCPTIKHAACLYSQRNHFIEQKRFASNFPENVLHKGTLVYVGNYNLKVKTIKAFSLGTSVVGCGLVPYILSGVEERLFLAKMIVGSVVCFFMFINPILLNILTRRYVSCMYYENETEKFTATIWNLFLMKIDIVFHPDEVDISSGPISTITVRGKHHLILDRDSFFDDRMYLKATGHEKYRKWSQPEDQEAADEFREFLLEEERDANKKEKEK